MIETQFSSTAARNAESVAVVIVSYASDRVLPHCIRALNAQTRCADLIVVVDNSSPDTSYLDKLTLGANATLLRSSYNLGFCGGNNLGYQVTREYDYVMFVNPDTFLDKHFICKALEWMRTPTHANVGILTGTLLGFDIEKNVPTGLIDSTGIDHTWYGRWFDIDQGLPAKTTVNLDPREVSAICGALMFCRNSALKGALLRGREVFDERFFMYKEDIDLSLRVSKQGWKLVHHPNMQGHHCRGWKGRRTMSAQAKLGSARNELIVNLRYRRTGILYSVAKYLYVRFIEPYASDSRVLTRKIS